LTAYTHLFSLDFRVHWQVRYLRQVVALLTLLKVHNITIDVPKKAELKPARSASSQIHRWDALFHLLLILNGFSFSLSLFVLFYAPYNFGLSILFFVLLLAAPNLIFFSMYLLKRKPRGNRQFLSLIIIAGSIAINPFLPSPTNPVQLQYHAVIAPVIPSDFKRDGTMWTFLGIDSGTALEETYSSQDTTKDALIKVMRRARGHGYMVDDSIVRDGSIVIHLAGYNRIIVWTSNGNDHLGEVRVWFSISNLQ
jgi:hypothetical protein